MFEAISAAKESVYLEMYIFEDDMRQYDFLKLLKEKARSGLRVRIILDSFGSMNFGSEAISLLRESGAELYFFTSYVYFLHVTHRKILVVDEKRAFIGGVNFTQKHRLWNDLAMSIRGKLVKHIIRSFAKVYVECGGTDPVIVAQNKHTILDKTRTWLVEHFPTKHNFVLKKIYKEHIDNAKENIILVTPYFLPSRWLIRALKNAVERGVRVELMLPKSTDVPLLDHINYFYMSRLSKMGMNFYVDQKMNHAKAMIIDGKEGIVGSQNLDFSSFALNNEIGVFMKDSSAIKDLLKIYEKWKKEASLFDYKTYKVRWFDYIIYPIFSVFSRIL